MKPPFVPQVIPVSSQSFTLGGNALTFDLPRESLIEKVVLWFEANITTAATAASIDGLAKLAGSVTLRGSIANGSYEPFSGMTGPDLYEFAQIQRGLLPYKFGALSSVARCRVNIPIYFREFGFSSLAKNLLPAIPAWKMSDLKLTVKPATTAEADSNSIIVLASGVCGVEVHQFFRETVPDGFQTIKSSYETQVESAPATKNPYEIRLPSGGDFMAILLRSFDGTNTRQLDADTGGPITWPDGYVRLLELSRNARIDSDFARLRADNLESVVDSMVDGNAAFLFNRGGEHKVFQTGEVGQALNNVLLQMQTTSIANSSIRCVFRRLFDDNNLLGIQR